MPAWNSQRSPARYIMKSALMTYRQAPSLAQGAAAATMRLLLTANVSASGQARLTFDLQHVSSAALNAQTNITIASSH